MRKAENSTADTQNASIPLTKQIDRNRLFTRQRFFMGYLYRLFTKAPLYTHGKQLFAYIRRFRAIALTLRILTFLFTVLQTGTLVILSAALFLVILPVLVMLMSAVLLGAWIGSGRTNKKLSKKLDGKMICILFLTPQDNPFLVENAKDLASRGMAVAVVSPYWISSKGLSESKKLYFTAREEFPSVYLIRRYYFFSFRKHVAKRNQIAYLF
jgi:hypothetical protein